jgi:uroporphyrinogen-III synthase
VTAPLEGLTIAVAEGRQLEDLAEMLAREGATVHRCPLVSILDAPDPVPVMAWIDDLIAGKFSHVVLLTGEGLRRLLGFAERAGLREEMIAALAKTRTLTRGPKPARALKEIGLNPTLVAAAPTSDGVIETLRGESLRGATVGVQLYAPDHQEVVDFLAQQGVTACPILPYVYTPASDGERVAELITLLAAGQVQVLVITSSPQVDRLFEVAAERNLTESLMQGLARACVAAVGPIAAGTFENRGVRVHLFPERGWVMKNLVLQIVRWRSG